MPRDDLHVVHLSLQALLELDKVWGFARIGLALSDAHYEQQPVTVEQMAEICTFSKETVRKHLKPLLNTGRAHAIKEGRNIRYCANPAWAARTRDMLLHVRERVGENQAELERADPG
jgi:DNA-binding transcriptional ArsR family regulator